jgi:hypothetical protein
VGSISSVNPGTAELLQTLSNLGSPVMSSPAMVSALESAPPGDIVQLSMATTQMEGMDAMFGNPDSSNTAADPTLAGLESDPFSQAADTNSTATQTADQQLFSTLAANAVPAQPVSSQTSSASDTQPLLDPTAAAGLSGSIFDVFG